MQSAINSVGVWLRIGSRGTIFELFREYYLPATDGPNRRAELTMVELRAIALLRSFFSSTISTIND